MIVLVHRQHQIECGEVAPGHLPCSLSAEIDTPACGGTAGAGVRRLADMVGVGARRIHPDGKVRRTLAEGIPEDAFRRGRATDVAHADEKNPSGGRRFPDLPTGVGIGGAVLA